MKLEGRFGLTDVGAKIILMKKIEVGEKPCKQKLNFKKECEYSPMGMIVGPRQRERDQL